MPSSVDPQSVHEPVLMEATITGLALLPGMVVVDGTVGGAGHAQAITKLIGHTGTYIGIDLDSGALAHAERILSGATVVLVEQNYRALESVVRSLGISGVDRVLIDLGLSSDQLEQSGRGFTFSREEPLLMTFQAHPKSDEVTAYDVVNTWSESTLADIIYGFGGDHKSRRIAHAIVRAREQAPIETSWELGVIIKEACGSRGRIHPATQTFQAIRMAVNDEMGSLTDGLEGARAVLNKGGRIAVISFESVTDRVVKQTFREWARTGEMEIITKRPIVATRAEISANPRSRSAKLRIIQKR
jgi:16S rRNA (cytosine1402-N4)-methyltransferase